MNAKTLQKRLVICADDFGASEAIDEGVLRLAEAGRLNATSCLVLGPTFRQHAARLAETGLQTGLHINFTESMGQPGFYRPLGLLVRDAWLRRLDARVLERQIVAQLDAFENIMGRAPDFVDGHQHVHQFPQIREVLLAELSRRYPGKRPWLRSTANGGQQQIPLAQRIKAHIITLLGARQFRRQASVLGFALNHHLAGVYNFQGGQAAYQALLHAWLKQMQAGDVLMCHPAASHNPADSLGMQRVAEYSVLASQQTGRWLADYSIYLFSRTEAGVHHDD